MTLELYDQICSGNLSELLCRVDYRDKNFAKAIEYIKRLEIYFKDVEKVKKSLEEFAIEFSYIYTYGVKDKKIQLGEESLVKLNLMIEELITNFEKGEAFDNFLEVDFDPEKLDNILTIEDKAKRDEIIERAFLFINAKKDTKDETREKLLNILEIIFKNSQLSEKEKDIFVKIYQGLLIKGIYKIEKADKPYNIDKAKELNFEDAKKRFESWLNQQEERELFKNIGNYSDFLQEEKKEEKATIVATQALLRAKKPYKAYQSMVETTTKLQGLLVGNRKSKEFEALRKAAEKTQGLLRTVKQYKIEKFELCGITEPDKIEEAICLLDYLKLICGENECTIEFVALLYKECREEFNNIVSTITGEERKCTIRDLLSSDGDKKSIAESNLYKTLCKKYEIDETNSESLNDVIKKVKEKNEEKLKLMSFKICLKGIIGFEGLKYLNDEKIYDFYKWLKDQIPNMASMAFDDSFKKRLSKILASTLAICKVNETMESAEIVKDPSLEDSFFEEVKLVTKLNNESELKGNLEKVINNLESIKKQLKLYKIKNAAKGVAGILAVSAALIALAYSMSYIPNLVNKLRNQPQQNDDDNDKDKTEEEAIKN